ASPMLWRTGLGSNSLTGSPKLAPWGKRPTLTVTVINFVADGRDGFGPPDKFLTVMELPSRAALDTPWQRRGGRDINKMPRSHHCLERTGWFVQLPINWNDIWS